MAPTAETPLMKAIAVMPGMPNSVHLGILALRSLSDVADGRGALLTEYYVEDEAFVVKVPQGLKEVDVTAFGRTATPYLNAELLQNPNGAIKIYCEVG